MKSAGKVSTLLIAVLSVLVIFLSVLLLSGSKNAIPAPIDGIYQSAEFPDGSCYTAQFSGDQFHIHWKWSGQEQTILSGLFEVVDEAKGIYLLYDSQERGNRHRPSPKLSNTATAQHSRKKTWG